MHTVQKMSNKEIIDLLGKLWLPRTLDEVKTGKLNLLKMLLRCVQLNWIDYVSLVTTFDQEECGNEHKKSHTSFNAEFVLLITRTSSLGLKMI